MHITISSLISAALLLALEICMAGTMLANAPCNGVGAGQGQSNGVEAVSVAQASTPMAGQYRTLWLERTQGENIALGKPVKFSSVPAYGPTHDDKDEYNLTDGKLSSRTDDAIWHTSDAVGWQSEAIEGIQMLIDLGEVHPVDKVAVRLLGGGRWATFVFPQEIALVVSEDGKNCYEVASLHSLQPAEKDQDGQAGCFYLPETGLAYVYPFMFDNLRTKARYIGLKAKNAQGGLVADELAVFEGKYPVADVKYDESQRTAMFMSGVALAPFHGVFPVSANITTPNSFRVSDLRDAKERLAAPVFVFELPAGISLLETQGKVTSARIERNGKPYVRWNAAGKIAKPDKSSIGELYFRVDDAAALRDGDKAYMYAQGPGCQTNETVWPIKILTIPAVPAFTNLHVSLAWMHESSAMHWPDFLNSWRHLGFNAVSAFPRNWRGGQAPEDIAAFLKEARARGFKVVYNESPFGAMANKHGDKAEIRSQLPAGKFGSLCPSYRGQYYQEEIKRVGDLYAASMADYIFYDIECWSQGAAEAGVCLRCQERFKKSGKPLPDFLTDLGVEMTGDLNAAVKSAGAKGGWRKPITGLYNVHAGSGVYQGVYDFAKLYPGQIDVGMPSLYCKGDAATIQRVIRDNYKKTGCRAVLPWLSAGTYGEFEPYKIEHFVLEAILNGAAGITYYWFGDFDSPMDYYYHAKALAALAPYENLLIQGTLREVEADNKTLYYTAWGMDKEILLLVGNYKDSRETASKITIPLTGKIASIRDIRQECDIPPEKVLSVNVEPQTIKLYHIKAK